MEFHRITRYVLEIYDNSVVTCFPCMKTRSIDPVQNISRQINAYGFTNFIDEAKLRLALLNPESVEYAIIEFLLNHAVGRKNAKNWKIIDAHLKQKGLEISKNTFQTSILKKSRKSPFFIGSNYDGYFIIETKSDVESVRTFYKHRIAKEEANLNALAFLDSRARLKEEVEESLAVGVS
jgi:hypothetical protein